MKALVIYDSRYGNTEKIAHAIREGLSGAPMAPDAVEVIRAGDAHPDLLVGFDLLLAGAPTHGSQISQAMREFLDRIPKDALAGVKVAAFDTRTDVNKLSGAVRVFGKILDRLGYAAEKISSSLERLGGQVVRPPEGFIVRGTEGPLEDGELERAADWARQITA